MCRQSNQWLKLENILRGSFSVCADVSKDIANNKKKEKTICVFVCRFTTSYTVFDTVAN